jgi:putative ABC transport system substrate-binding protein
MRRREFITLLGGAVGWPLGARAQQPMPVVGFLHPGLREPLAHEVAAFHRGLNESGFMEGQNVAIEYRWAEGQYARLPALAAELVRRQVAVIVAAGGAISALVVKAATTTIPTVMLSGSDPVKLGLVASMNRPGGNITGVSQNIVSLEAKRVEVLSEVLPGATTIAVLVNPTNPNAEPIAKDLETVARALGRQLHVLEASTNADFDAAFATISRHRAGGLVVSGDAFFVSQRDQLVALSARHALPAIYFVREFTDAGGLMSYGTDLVEAYHDVGRYTGRILKGAKPAELPVIQQSTKVELVINLKTAKTLGLKIPLPLLGRADEVIE